MGSSGRLITSADILNNTIVNADVNAAAAIAYGKLSLGASIVSADLVANAATMVHAANALGGAATNTVGPNVLVDASVTSAGGFFIALVGGSLSNTAANSFSSFFVGVDAAANVQVGVVQQGAGGATYQMPMVATYPVGVLSAGAHHVYLRWGCSASTTTTIAYGYFILFELIR